MKKFILSLLAVVSLAFLFQLPAKADFLPMNLEEETVWITPTGVAIPSEFMNDWENYIAVQGKKFTTIFCPTINGVHKIKCIKGTPNDCTKAFECLPCVNCN